MADSEIEALYREAEALKDAGNYEEAIAKCLQVVEADTNHLLGHLTLAVLLGKVGVHEEAVKHAEQAVQIDPTDPFNFTALSVTYQRAFAGTGNQAYIRMAEDARDRAQMLQGRH
jgi:tetratricopeptide (TPR) repeat protein